MQSIPYRHSPNGCSDSIDETQLIPGGMSALSNLVPAPDTKGQWVPRPAALKLAGSDTFTPGFVSCQIVVGSVLYGLVSSALTAGFDEPFAYNLLSGALITVTGITAANVPTSPPTTGLWTPPHMEVIGTKIIVTHTGFSGTGTNFFGVFDIANPLAPAWSTANTATNALPSVPVWVEQFFQRAYFFCNPAGAQPAVLATDSLDPLTRTAPTYTLTFGDNIPITCGGQLPLDNQLGGQVQSLIVFKGVSNMFQITGDFAATATNGIPFIQMNALNIATGTLAPNSITATPKGLMFVAPDGLRLIGFDAHVSDPIGFSGTGISVPFSAAVIPSRICAACNATTVRISTQNGAVAGNPFQEWCYDIVRAVWHGPHTFPASLISAYGSSFISTRVGGIKGLWSSDISPTATSTYVENGAAMTCTYQTIMLPERQDMRECSMVESLFYEGHGSGNFTFNVTAFNQSGVAGGFASINVSGSSTLWDSFTWGSSVWLGTQNALAARVIPWTAPIVFDRMGIQITVTASAGIRLGDLYMIYQPLGYSAVP